MRQRDDIKFVDLLNQVRVGELDKNNEQLLLSHFIDKNSPILLVLFILFAEFVPVNDHNIEMLNNI